MTSVVSLILRWRNLMILGETLLLIRDRLSPQSRLATIIRNNNAGVTATAQTDTTTTVSVRVTISRNNARY